MALVGSFCLCRLDVPQLDPGVAGSKGACVRRGTEQVRVGLALLRSARPQCLLLWAGCHEAALSRLPSRMLHFSVWRETVAVINLAGAFQAVDVARLTPAVGGHWCPQPLAHLSPSTHPTPSARGAAQQPGRRRLFYLVSGFGPQPIVTFPNVSASALSCCVLSAPNQCLLLVSLQRR